MANSWLRLFHDMPNDPKWRTIAKASKQPIPVVLAVYLHLLIIASCAAERGTVGAVNSEDIASALDVDCEAVEAILKAMEGRVLTVGKLSGWDGRQKSVDEGAAERAKAWRERKKAEKKAANGAERVRTEANATERARTTDKKREEEIKRTTKTLASTAVAVPAGRLVCTIPLNQGDHEVFDADVQGWTALYPAVDIRQELRTMKGWLQGSPQRRKTRSGIGKFINAWFARAQNSGRGAGHGTHNSKSDNTIEALRRSLEIEPDQDFTGEDGSEETGSDRGSGPKRVLEGSIAIRT